MHKKTAKLAVFAGFETPLWYKGIAQEHLAVRNNLGVFDISHMGRFMVSGVGSERFLNYVITNDVSVLSPNSAQYSVMCNTSGGIIDDFVVYRLEKEKFLAVFNAGNREKDYDWLSENSEDFRVSIEDISEDVAMLAVQGPKAEEALQEISSADLSRIGRFRCAHSRLGDVEVFVSRTGYTGEDGFEIFVWGTSLGQPDNGVRLWNTILDTCRSYEIEPCGLGARDTLRLEAGMCLYGNDIDESTTPLEARLSFVVKFKKEDFVGKDAMVRQKDEGVKRKRVGIRMIEQGIPRPGFEVFDETGEKIGLLTSGTYSPLLKQGIGMAYLQTAKAQEGNVVNVKIRSRLVKGRTVSLPFYATEKYGYKRTV